jgi:hypothetical protein
LRSQSTVGCWVESTSEPPPRSTRKSSENAVRVVRVVNRKGTHRDVEMVVVERQVLSQDGAVQRDSGPKPSPGQVEHGQTDIEP